jgi:hypothetical protein
VLVCSAAADPGPAPNALGPEACSYLKASMGPSGSAQFGRRLVVTSGDAAPVCVAPGQSWVPSRL